MTFFLEVGERVTHEDRRNRNRRKAHIHAQQGVQEEKAEVEADGQKGHPGIPDTDGRASRSLRAQPVQPSLYRWGN